LEAKSGFVKMGGLLGVTDVKLDVIGALERKKICLGDGRFLGASIGGWLDNPCG
jgi:hypothetical protein